MRDNLIHGVNLKIAGICRSKYGQYPEYHTSLDNFNLVSLTGLIGGFKVAKTAINNLIKKTIPISKVICEPQLGKEDYIQLYQKKR